MVHVFLLLLEEVVADRVQSVGAKLGVSDKNLQGEKEREIEMKGMSFSPPLSFTVQYKCPCGPHLS